MEDRVTLAEAFSALAGYGPALWCGVAAGIATFIVEVILCRGRQETCSGKAKRPHADCYKNEFAVSRQGARGHADKPNLYRQLRIHSKRKAPHQADHVHQCKAAAHDYAVLPQLSNQGLFGI